MHDLISAIDSSILSVDCIEWLNILQQIVQQLFAQLLSFLCHNTSRNSCFFSASVCRSFAIHFASGFPFHCCDWCTDVDLEVLATAGCQFVGREMLLPAGHLEEVPAGFIIARPSAESLARRKNAVVSTYSNDIVLLSLTSKDLD
ncbi:hypothetical protein F511_40372 [Dorcoceras hygrometricum]|uniref:Uncharacterized protein n=1 Tax=Dorcoceras hygrometricum TaxID=472368 RepID=A0A2Z7CYC7_9LAMI|nr:hypothetical protein F511_40372 [Dorcoceras hygrometricum]